MPEMMADLGGIDGSHEKSKGTKRAKNAHRRLVSVSTSRRRYC